MTRDDIIRMAREAEIGLKDRSDELLFEAAYAAGAAAEREACARVCDGLADIHEKMNQWGQHKTAETLAQAIRARGQA